MPQTRSNGVQTPVNADTFNLTGDLATMAESVTSVVSVANQAAGDTVATNRAAAGFAVSDAKPLFIYNQATKTLQCKDSSGWRDYSAALGLIGNSNNSAASVGLGGGAVVCDLTAVTLVAGRSYRVSYKFNTICAGAANEAIAVNIVKSITSDTTTAGTGLDNTQTLYTAPVANQGCTSLAEMIYKASTTETVNIKANLTRISGASTYDISLRVLSVHDCGANV